MEFKNRQNARLTTTEGKTHWHSRSMAVCAMIVSADDSVLITQRSAKMDTHPNKWCLPCGYLDWDEGIHHALVREVFEEVGININGMDAVMYHINDGANADGLQNVTFHFYVCLDKKAADVELKLSDEVQAAYWLTLDEISSDTFQGKEAAFGHFERIKKATSSTDLFPLHVAKLDTTAATLFEY